MLTKYRALLCAVDCGSLTKATESMHCTQSALSRMILDLESLWGFQLLIRSKSGVRPTPDCLKILPLLRRICAENELVRDTVMDIRGVLCGTVRIGVFSSIATFWLPHVIARFGKAHPDIEFEILMGDYSEIEDWVAETRVDFGFAALPVSKRVKALPLHEDELLAILPETHALADREKVSVADLAKEPMIMLEKGRQAEISNMFEKQHLQANVKFRTFDDYALLSMVENGIAVGVLPKLILERLNYRVEVREIEPPCSRIISLIVNGSTGISPAASRFLSVFENELAMRMSLKPKIKEFLCKLQCDQN